MSKSYKSRKVGENLNWKIGVLEAQAGLDTSIENAKAAARSKGEIDRELAEAEIRKLKAEKLSRKTFHLKKEIRKSLKKAKTFETQKIVKRIKTVRKDLEKKSSKEETDKLKTTIERLERELEMIKTIQTDQLCDLAFYKAIKKDNTLRNHEAFSSLAEPKGTHEVNEDSEAVKLRSNVESRIFGSKPLKDMQAVCIGDLLNIVAPELNVERVASKPKPNPKENKSQPPKKSAQPVGETESLSEEKSDDSEESDDDEREFEAGDEESDDDEREVDDGSEESADEAEESKPKKRRASEIESDDEKNVSRPKQEKKKLTKAQKERKKAKAQQKKPEFDADGVPTTSMFMDTLGGYKSSDPEDYEDEAFDQIYGKPKKNRPGQRARKMMWEKLHGNNANHIKAQIEAEKQAAQVAKWRAQQTFGDKPRQRATTEKLHPSWEAKKKQKNAAVVPFKGSKITFKDEGGDKNHSNIDPATLHPSWEAKRRQKEAQAALASVKNTKIVFDSD
ncbi:hypothetical protein K7432_002539 [Basidiobolus ranarum]|uniref:Bud22 domain-containing protein n=1 Tax=Basidiobolus ranarum TaxID=34480 RepID=A0ABR2X1F4_9FUNG